MKKNLPLVILSFAMFFGCKKDKGPLAAFTVSKSNYYLSEQVVLSNTTTNATSYQWDFGDAQSSTEQSPQHAYSKAGTYTIKLTTNGKSSATKRLRLTPE